MTRCCSLLIVALAATGLARPNNTAEAARVLDQFLAGTMPLNPAINRIQFLGAEAFASSELILALKRTSDPRKRTQLLDFLASLGQQDDEVERLFLRALQGEDPGERMLAARGLGKLKSTQAVPPLIALLEHPMLGQRREAARALGEIGRPAASAPLLKAAAKEQDLELKVLMISAAGRAGDKRQAGKLSALLKDDSESTRLAAGQALCVMGLPACLPFAQKLLGSSDRNERFQAVMLFEGSSARTAGKTLTPMLKDPDDKVRARAARILVQGGDQSRLEWLVLESAQARGEKRLIYEDELEKLHLDDERRQAILKKAGLQ